MTKDEIEKGCKLCASASDCSNCNDCPAYTNCVSAAAYNLITEQENEIAQLKADNSRLTAKLGQVLLSIDTVKEMNAMCNIDEQRKRVVKEFAEKVKEKLSNTPNGWAYTPYVDEILKEFEE